MWNKKEQGLRRSNETDGEESGRGQFRAKGVGFKSISYQGESVAMHEGIRSEQTYTNHSPLISALYRFGRG